MSPTMTPFPMQSPFLLCNARVPPSNLVVSPLMPALQIFMYLPHAKRALGVLPTLHDAHIPQFPLCSFHAYFAPRHKSFPSYFMHKLRCWREPFSAPSGSAIIKQSGIDCDLHRSGSTRWPEGANSNRKNKRHTIAILRDTRGRLCTI